MLAWSRASAQRLFELDDTDDRIARAAGRARRPARDAEATLAATISAARHDAARRLGDQVTAELTLLAMPHARVAVSVAGTTTPTGWRSTGALCASAADGVDDVELLLAANVGADAAAAGQGRLGRRAVPGDAGAGGGAGRHQPGADLRLRRGRRGRRRQGRGRGGPPAGDAGAHLPGGRGHAPAPGGGVRRPARGRGRSPATGWSPRPACRCSTTRPGCGSSPGCWPAWRSPRPPWRTPRSSSPPPARCDTTRSRETRPGPRVRRRSGPPWHHGRRHEAPLPTRQRTRVCRDSRARRGWSAAPAPGIPAGAR